MKTDYEIRNPRLDGIFISFTRMGHAQDWWMENVKYASRTSIHFGAVVVEHTRETHAEAETARLDFMIQPGAEAKFAAACLKLPADSYRNADEWPENARKAIDIARGKPAETVNVIWPTKL